MARTPATVTVTVSRRAVLQALKATGLLRRHPLRSLWALRRPLTGEVMWEASTVD